MRALDIKVGDKFGRWTVIAINVINPASKSQTSIKCCLCECSCNKHTRRYIPPSKLHLGRTQSCGCLKAEQLAERNANNSSVKVGNIYGKLIVIQDLGIRKQSSRNKNERWSLCQCECGSKPIEVKNNMLQNGKKKSCGCLHSAGEFKIKQILEENNITYLQEYSFPDLISNKGRCLRFDFAIFQNNQLSFLIEFDGRQHYTGPEATWSHSITLEEIQQRDELKNIYCKNHGYILKRIPFYNTNQITFSSLFDDTFNV